MRLSLFHSLAPRLAAVVLVAAGLIPLARGSRNILDFGARPDGVTLNTVAINATVAAVVRDGGGTVIVPAGRYLTGTIYLKSHVILELAAGAVLLGSTDLKDYPENPPPAPLDTREFRRAAHVYPDRLEYGRFALIVADGQEHVGVVGPGSIDGQGDHPNFSKRVLVERGLTRDQAHLRRPFGLSFVRCTNVRVRGITLRNLAFWCEGYLDCSDVVIEGVTVDSPAEDRNNDGVDLDGSRHVRVSHCKFNTGDDSICLKASFRDCEDIVIEHCACSSLANGVKCGTMSNGGFKNIVVSHLTMEHVGGAGLALEVVDGGVMDGITVSDVVMNQVGAAVFIRLGDRGSTWMKPEDHAVGAVRNITIRNVDAKVFTPYDGRPLASSITGLPGHPVEGVTLTNVRISSERAHPRTETRALVGMTVPEPATAYPEYSMFGSLPAYGLYVRHARQVTLTDVTVGFPGEDRRSALVADDVDGLVLAGWRSRTLTDSEPVLWLRDVRRAAITRATLPDPAVAFLHVEGESAEISLEGAERFRARKLISVAPNLPATVVRD